MLKWTAYIVAGLLLIVVLAGVIGMLLPQGHRASRTVVHDAAPEAVFTAITDFGQQPAWRTGVTAVDVLAGADGAARVREHGRNGTIVYRVDRHEPNSRLVMRIDDPSLPFGGTWTYELKAVPEGTALTITEDGEIYNPFFRLLSKLVFSPYDTIDTYQADLRRRLGGLAPRQTG